MVKDEIELPLNRMRIIPLAGDAPITLSLSLEAGAFVHLVLENPDREGKVELCVLSPRGRQLTRSRWRAAKGGRKESFVYAEEAGCYRLELLCSEAPGEGPTITAVARSGSHRGSASDRHRTAASWAYDAAEIAFEEGDLAIASGGLQIAREHFSAAGDPLGQARAWIRLGDVFSRQGNPRGAMDAWVTSLSLMRDGGDPSCLGRLLEKIGEAHLALGKPGAAALSFRSALAVFERAGLVSGQISALFRTGLALSAAGLDAQALDAHERCFELLALVDSPREEVLVIASMGRLYLSTGHPVEARAMLLHGRLSAERIGDRQGEALCLKHLGDTLLELGDLTNARDCLERASSSFEERGEASWRAAALTSLGSVHLEAERFEAAARTLSLALGRRDSPADLRRRGAVRVLLARCWYGRGRLEEAAAEFRRAQALYSGEERSRGRIAALHGEALAAYDLGRFESARELSAAAIRETEALDQHGGPPACLPALRVPPEAPWHLHIHCLMSLAEIEPRAGHARRALEVSTRWRRRRLRAPGPAGMGPDGLGLDGLGADDDPAAAEPELRLARARMRSENPRLAALLEGSLESYAAPSARGPHGAQVLTFFLGERRSYAWLGSGGRLRAFVLPPRVEIDAAAQSFFDLLAASRRGDDATRRRAGEHLAGLLFSELGAYLEGSRLLIVPDGSLSFVPFSALPSPVDGPGRAPGPRYLVEDFEIATLAEGSRGAFPLPGHPAGCPERLRLAVIGRWESPAHGPDPPAAASSRSIAECFGSDHRRTFATLPAPEAESLHDRRRDGLEGYSFVHLAGQFSSFPNRADFLLTGGPEGETCTAGPRAAGTRVVSLQQIRRLRLGAELVSLDLRPDPLGDGQQEASFGALLDGLLGAGARRLLVRLWDTAEEGREEALGRFFRTLLEDWERPGARFAQALRRTQLSMLRDPRWSNPRYWSGLQLLQGPPRCQLPPDPGDGFDAPAHRRIFLDPPPEI